MEDRWLWVPYFVLFIVLVILVFISFYRYHLGVLQKYRDNERGLSTNAKKYRVVLGCSDLRWLNRQQSSIYMSDVTKQSEIQSQDVYSLPVTEQSLVYSTGNEPSYDMRQYHNQAFMPSPQERALWEITDNSTSNQMIENGGDTKSNPNSYKYKEETGSLTPPEGYFYDSLNQTVLPSTCSHRQNNGHEYLHVDVQTMSKSPKMEGNKRHYHHHTHPENNGSETIGNSPSNVNGIHKIPESRTSHFTLPADTENRSRSASNGGATVQKNPNPLKKRHTETSIHIMSMSNLSEYITELGVKEFPSLKDGKKSKKGNTLV